MLIKKQFFLQCLDIKCLIIGSQIMIEISFSSSKCLSAGEMEYETVIIFIAGCCRVCLVRRVKERFRILSVGSTGDEGRRIFSAYCISTAGRVSHATSFLRERLLSRSYSPKNMQTGGRTKTQQ